MECHSNQIDEAVATKYKINMSVDEECHLLLGFCLQTILYQSPSSIDEGMTCPAGLSIG
jgi:hypothetical protein